MQPRTASEGNFREQMLILLALTARSVFNETIEELLQVFIRAHESRPLRIKFEERRRALLRRASCAASLAENATTVTAANKARIEEDTWPMTQTMTPTRLLEIPALRGI